MESLLRGKFGEREFSKEAAHVFLKKQGYKESSVTSLLSRLIITRKMSFAGGYYSFVILKGKAKMKKSAIRVAKAV